VHVAAANDAVRVSKNVGEILRVKRVQNKNTAATFDNCLMRHVANMSQYHGDTYTPKAKPSTRCHLSHALTLPHVQGELDKTIHGQHEVFVDAQLLRLFHKEGDQLLAVNLQRAVNHRPNCYYVRD
jgi:hypothetical protein